MEWPPTDQLILAILEGTPIEGTLKSGPFQLQLPLIGERWPEGLNDLSY